MIIKQLYTNCLSQACYYIESDGEAAIIDPLRDPEEYLEIIDKKKSRLKYIFETHFHADFVSGHLDLERKTGAEIIFGPEAKPRYNATIAKDNQEFNLGKIKLKVLHTPGHTVESICILLIDEDGKEHALFTGDTLFVGDVGRPDLMSGNKSSWELAELLYNSINNVIKKLPEEIIIYPGHGPGSLCGKNIGSEKWTTLKEQLKNNYALQDISKDEFIKQVIRDLPVPPAYFFQDASINVNGYESFDKVLENSLKPLKVSEFINYYKKGVTILDTRPPHNFELGFIKGSINIGLNGEFAPWVGSLIDLKTPLLIVAEEDKEKEVITRLSRIGYDNVIGYLKGGIPSWKKERKNLETIESVDGFDFCYLYDTREYIIIDVRKETETAKEKVLNAIHIPLHELNEKIKDLDPDKKYIIYCVGGYRSMIAASMMKRKGIKNVMNVTGGINHLKQAIPALIH